MRAWVLFLLATCVLAQANWEVALPGWQYAFPLDHGNHPTFKTEWWYFTGNLTAQDGREFGYELTFFREGIILAENDPVTLSRFVTHQIKFAHFAISDLAGNHFTFHQKISRGAYGEAGFNQGTRLAWIDNWSCELGTDGIFHLKAKAGRDAVDLILKSAKAPVIQGENGVSQKADGVGHASHYYSMTRLQTQGTLTSGTTFPVQGTSWFDHEWATNQLAANQVGWDWLSLQFDDGTEMMLIQLRLKGGGRDSHSGGSFVDARGKVTQISNADFTMDPVSWWTSRATKGRYPTTWKITVPKLGLSFQVKAAMEDQELSLKPMGYWEGAIRIEGTRDKARLTGKGYLEMIGYAGKVIGLQGGTE